MLVRSLFADATFHVAEIEAGLEFQQHPDLTRHIAAYV
jgi:hypothetical protein